MHSNRIGADLAIGAALYALIEIGLALTIGRFLEWGRAEALLFFAFRPWCLAGMALAARGRSAAFRVALYGAALFLASISQAILLIGLGADNPVPELLRGLIGGAMLIVPIELLLFAIATLSERERRTGPRGWAAIAALVLLAAGAGRILSAYDTVLLPPARTAGERPPLMLLTGLPIVWGEGNWSAPRPSAAYRALEAEFAIRPLDALDAAALAKGGLLLVAQPRLLAPEELVTLDDWVRGGGRVLILTDPMLIWPSALPPGDVRRPPPVGLLSPLLGHWGVTLVPAEDGGVIERLIGNRKLVSAAEGRFEAPGAPCALSQGGLIAGCRIGAGRAMLVADADLMSDRLWTAPGPGEGGQRHVRTADNPLIVADWLDSLASVERQRAAGDVIWTSPRAKPGWAVALAVLPVLIAAAAGLALRLRARNP